MELTTCDVILIGVLFILFVYVNILLYTRPKRNNKRIDERTYTETTPTITDFMDSEGLYNTTPTITDFTDSEGLYNTTPENIEPILESYSENYNMVKGSSTAITIEITTGKERYSGTNGRIYAVFPKNKVLTETKSYQLDTKWFDDFEPGSVKKYYINDQNITKDMLKNMKIYLYAAGGLIDLFGFEITLDDPDDWLFYKIRAWYGNELVIDKTPNKWLRNKGARWSN